MKTYERFLKYVRVHTASDDRSGASPSAAREFDLAKILEAELRELGCENVRLDEHCYVYGTIPATKGYESLPCLGFIAHVDTIPDFCGENVSPRLIENYDGGDVVLGDSGRVLSPKTFPHLPSLAGRTLIVTDGKTLLGADDKAGVAEIMTMAERLLNNEIPHGKIAIGFTPDEEIGYGADHFDIEGFGADYAYTVDGGEEGSLEFENFNAAAAVVKVNGVNVHPGSAKDIMINASTVAMEFNALLPGGDVPEKTSGYEGFFHLTEMVGNVEHATLEYIIRDHSAAMYDARVATMKHVAKVLNERYGDGTVELSIREQYRNMIEKILPHRHLIDNAVEAAKRHGIEANVDPIRGGTDGARLSYMGLPCPNLGTAGYAFHGPYEHTTVEGLDMQTDILMEVVKIYSENK